MKGTPRFPNCGGFSGRSVQIPSTIWAFTPYKGLKFSKKNEELLTVIKEFLELADDSPALRPRASFRSRLRQSCGDVSRPGRLRALLKGKGAAVEKEIAPT